MSSVLRDENDETESDFFFTMDSSGPHNCPWFWERTENSDPSSSLEASTELEIGSENRWIIVKGSSPDHPLDSSSEASPIPNPIPFSPPRTRTTPSEHESTTSSEHESTTSSERESSTKEDANSGKMEVLLCSKCKFPLASIDEILHAYENQAWKKHIFAYELDLFGNERPIWAYSATNPSSTRFDLIRVKPKVSLSRKALERCENEEAPSESAKYSPSLAEEVSLFKFKGPYTNEHSFFLGYEWCYCSCLSCSKFVGWGFASHEKLEAHRRRIEEKEKGGEREGAEQASGKSSPTKVRKEQERGGSSPRSSVGEIRSDLPEPDFVGLIITHCTGSSEYTMEEFSLMLSTAADLHRSLNAEGKPQQPVIPFGDPSPYLSVEEMGLLYRLITNSAFFQGQDSLMIDEEVGHDSRDSEDVDSETSNTS